jgi:hypothetical protein
LLRVSAAGPEVLDARLNPSGNGCNLVTKTRTIPGDPKTRNRSKQSYYPTMRMPFPLVSVKRIPSSDDDDGDGDNEEDEATTGAAATVDRPDEDKGPQQEPGAAVSHDSRAPSARDEQLPPLATVLPLSMQLMRLVTGGGGRQRESFNCPHCKNGDEGRPIEEMTSADIQNHIMMEELLQQKGSSVATTNGNNTIITTAELFWCPPVSNADAGPGDAAESRPQPATTTTTTRRRGVARRLSSHVDFTAIFDRSSDLSSRINGTNCGGISCRL